VWRNKQGEPWRRNGEYAIMGPKKGDVSDMASIRERVSFSGILKGAGHEANCTVRAIKVSLPGKPSVFEYVNYSIENVSKPLPDGIYELAAQGKTIAVRNKNGDWISASG
jgi:hypothetical protein